MYVLNTHTHMHTCKSTNIRNGREWQKWQKKKKEMKTLSWWYEKS